MTTKNKILEAMYRLMHKLESDWTEELEQLNIYDDVEALYRSEGIEGDTLMGNIVLCFTILAYDNESRFLEPHKDRWENKKKILVKLAGLSVMTVEYYVKLLGNDHEEPYNVASWYLNYQKNWRFKQYITLVEYHSMTEALAKVGGLDAQEAIQIGKMLEIGEARRNRADELLDELEREFLNVNTAIEKEGRNRLTDMDKNFMSFESYLAKLKSAPPVKG